MRSIQQVKVVRRDYRAEGGWLMVRCIHSDGHIGPWRDAPECDYCGEQPQAWLDPEGVWCECSCQNFCGYVA
jgi:hypothetical protein